MANYHKKNECKDALVGAADWETRQTAELTNIGLTRPPQTDQNNNKWDDDNDDNDDDDDYYD